MKAKNKYIYELIFRTLSSKNYYIVYLLILASIIYPFFEGLSMMGSTTSFFNILFSPNIIFILSAVCISSIMIASEYNKDKNLMLRFESKENYVKTLLIAIMIVNTMLIFISLIFIFLEIFFLFEFKMENRPYYFYGISILTYTVFYIIKIYFLLQCISIIAVLVSQLINKVLAYFSFFIVILSNCCFGYKESGVISSIGQFRLLLSEYFSIHEYSNFFLEIMFASLYICLLLIIINALYMLIKKKKFEVKI